MIPHYTDAGSNPEWLREMRLMESEQTIDGEYDPEYVSGLKPKTEESEDEQITT